MNDFRTAFRPRPSAAARSLCLLGLMALASAGAARAAAFDVAVLPSRFELSGKSGARIGQSIEISNLGAVATQVSVRTLDWSYSAEGQIGYYDELREGSCRPWVTLERRTVSVPARGKRAVRFQIEAPPGAGRGECRFMVAIEGVEPAQQAVIQSNGASLNLPVTGRIAVAVYLRLDDAQPRLSLTEVGMREIGGRRTPTLTVTNAGDAHGRLDGSLEGIDARGRPVELVPEGTPILPGQTRILTLTPRSTPEGGATPTAYPVKASGTLDWDEGSFRISTEFK